MVQNGLKIDKPRCKLVDVVMAGKRGESKKVKKNQKPERKKGYREHLWSKQRNENECEG